LVLDGLEPLHRWVIQKDGCANVRSERFCAITAFNQGFA
jgi:hypothetical protein